MNEITCPVCRGGVLRRGDGMLEQSGDSYLPTVVWSCALCEYRRYEPATGAQWRSLAASRREADPVEAAQAAPRRAA